MEKVKLQNLYNNQRILYKYFPVSNEYATKYRNGNFVTYMFTPNIAKEDMEKSKGNEVIEKWRAIAFEGMIFYTSPIFFNDPFDAVLPNAPELVPTIDERQELIAELKEAHLIKKDEINRLLYSKDFDRALSIFLNSRGVSTEIQEELQKSVRNGRYIYRDEIAIACFSEVNDSKLMWAHYANSYTGFCIEYDFRRSGYSEFQRGIGKVIYTEKRPVMEENDNYNQYVRQVLAIKSECWSYEKEWRSINILPYAEYINKIYPIVKVKECIKAIYLGCHMKEDYQKEVAEYYKNTDVKVYRMKLREDTFDFYFEDFFSEG